MIYRAFKGTVGKVRRQNFKGVEYLTFPVVALVEGVITASNADGPELVLAEEFGHHPLGWAGRPVMMNHPQDTAGNMSSANDPETLEKGSLGQVFAPVVKDRKLGLEAWVEIERARVLNDDSAETLALLEKAEQDSKFQPAIEVSIGAFLDLEEKQGVWQGQEYTGIWRNVVPDHLALLKQGALGACSIKMGCGAVRAAKEKTVDETLKAWMGKLRTALGIKDRTASPSVSADESKTHQELLDLFAPRLTGRSAMTDVDRRSALEIALRNANPNFLGIVAVDDDEGVVVYEAFAEGGGGIRMYSQTYSTRADKISLGDEKKEVRSKTAFVPASASPCGCGGKEETAPEGVTDMAKTKKERVEALIQSKKNTFSEKQRGLLEACTDDGLTALEAIEAELPDPVAQVTEKKDEKKKDEVIQPPVPAATPTAAGAQLTSEQLVALLPAEMRSMLERQKSIDTLRKKELVGALKAASSAFTEEQLNAKPVEELEQLAQFANLAIVQYDGRMLASPRTPLTDPTERKEAPQPWTEALNKKNKSAAA